MKNISQITLEALGNNNANCLTLFKNLGIIRLSTLPSLEFSLKVNKSLYETGITTAFTFLPRMKQL